MRTQHHDNQYGPAPPRDQIRAHRNGDVAEDEQGACATDVPTSAAVREENQDYVRHFCNDDAYQQWLRRARREVPAPTPGLGDEPDPTH
ncbi:DUF3330 domain-containing protein [Chitiniphilus purpureus]|uniref:DUF3330 domain-containing protein n=1 Tax=Chitiniphilus purpureus TaxID=2981137 RepID=A0ABY6DMW9_9NEIS|nr:DUF3330 domain-containing protein [Chitiniphilus sp. CD1]UXY14451.1 DUF3330 domain-containing protein [Chitiniphilus sp. CD1]